MGLGQSVPSESEENIGDKETSTSDERSMQPNTPRRVGKQIHVVDNEILPPDPHHEIVLKFQKLQMDNIIEERNHSERIIREKEKLLKEKEETIRQQANLIKTQNELLGQQRKQRRMMSNVGTVKQNYDKVRPSKPLAKHTQFTKSATSLENIHSNGQDQRNRVTINDDYEQKYYDAEPYPPKRQEKPSQTFNAPNTPISNFPFSNPFQRDSRNSSSTTHQPNYHASSNVTTSNSNGSVSKPTFRQQLRRTQSNDYRRTNVESDELSELKQSSEQLLADLEKQTNYEVQKLDNAQNGDRPLQQITGVQGIFKCSGCRLARKYKTALVGGPQKCKKCGGDVGSRLTPKSCKSDDESQGHHLWNSDSEFISDVD